MRGVLLALSLFVSAAALGQSIGPSPGGGGGGVSSVGGSSTGNTLTATGGPVTASGTLNFELNLSHANTWAAAQTYANSLFIMLGSSTGGTTFTSDNAGASNFTLHFPAANDTVATLAGTQTLTNKTLTSPSISNPTIAGSFTATGLVTNADLANSSMTIAGHSVPLGGTQALASTDLSNTSNIPLLNVSQSFTKGQAVTPVALTPGTTVAVDASLSNNFTLAPVQNFTLSNPTNLKAGQTLNTWITQDGTGSRVLTLGSQYQAAGGSATLVLSTAASAKDLLSCISDTTSTLTCNLSLAVVH